MKHTPVFPDEPIVPTLTWGNCECFGLTKREYFAVKAMEGLIAGVRASGDGIEAKQLCNVAVMLADKLIESLNHESL